MKYLRNIWSDSAEEKGKKMLRLKINIALLTLQKHILPKKYITKCACCDFQLIADNIETTFSCIHSKHFSADFKGDT